MIYIITGPESSGKTTLSKLLSIKLKLPLNAEYARIFLTDTSSKALTQKDLIKILMAQETSCKEILTKHNHIICDTDALTIKLWNDVKFKKYSTLIENIISGYDFSGRTYFICYPDIPWEPDPLREHPKLEDRVKLFYKQIDMLKSLKANYHLIKGKDRLKQVLAILD